MSPLSPGKARMLNLAMLIAGYGFGQGSIFLAQTWLVAHGELELLALFGTHFAFAIFGILVVDASALIVLARHAASLQHGEESAASLWQAFWDISAFRAALAVLVIASGVTFALAADEPFTHAYALYATPAFLLWAVNAAGLLDGLRLSGISGVSGSLAYATSAIALVFARDLDPGHAGAVLGAAFSLGYLMTVAVQFLALRAVGPPPRFVRPRAAQVLASGRDGLLLLGSTLPGQVYYRVQLLMCAAWLGPAPTALFVYVKQVVVALSQLIGFVRRVEFPTLVQTLARERGSPARTIWREQRLGTRLAAAGTACMLAAGAALTLVGSDVARELGRYLAAFAPTVMTAAIFLAFSQGLAALGRYGAVSARALATAVVGVALSAALAPTAGLYGLAVADAVSAVAGSLWVLYLLARTRKE